MVLVIAQPGSRPRGKKLSTLPDVIEATQVSQHARTRIPESPNTYLKQMKKDSAIRLYRRSSLALTTDDYDDVHFLPSHCQRVVFHLGSCPGSITLPEMSAHSFQFCLLPIGDDLLPDSLDL